ncbi:kinase-like domain-containing protein [Leptodontidium sp. 2 PMI_412]|nr:kinase-like domain-containing protein [Leptodontidium sp. MPI-SDFR-AT-0119]KAH9204519.1 kinase-like domain-containing protein [Leptodontidium sp. 2 PMI_412]
METSQTTNWAPVRLPYLKPPSRIPAPLPMEKQFLESTAVLRDDASYHRVVAVGPHFIVKHGRGVREREGQTLLFLEKHLASFSFITVPKLYAMYRLPSNGHLCLVMERLDGESLEAMWPVLDDDEKSTVCDKLKDVFATIRKIPMPYPNFYGSVEKGPMPHHLFHSADADPAICGPFDSESEFNAALVRRLRAIWAENGKHSFKADFYERNLDAMLKGHEPRFSHSDLQPKNILVRRVQSQAGLASKCFEVALIDWEEAGWYPSYWEYSSLFVAFEWRDDWPERLEQIVDPWPSEAAALRMLYQDLWF